MSEEVPDTVETLTRKLAAAKARITTLAEQLMVAERVQAGLRSRIASLEQQMEAGPQIIADPVIDLGRHRPPAPVANGQRAASAPEPAAPIHLDYAFGDHEDDLLPRST